MVMFLPCLFFVDLESFTRFSKPSFCSESLTVSTVNGKLISFVFSRIACEILPALHHFRHFVFGVIGTVAVPGTNGVSVSDAGGVVVPDISGVTVPDNGGVASNISSSSSIYTSSSSSSIYTSGGVSYSKRFKEMYWNFQKCPYIVFNTRRYTCSSNMLNY